MEWAELRPGARATPWNGETGGVLAMDVVGDLRVAGEVDLREGIGLTGPWPDGTELSVTALLPGAAAPTGGVGGPLVMLRTGTIGGGALLADAVKADGDGGTFLVTAERGDLSDLILVARGSGSGAIGRAFTSSLPRGAGPVGGKVRVKKGLVAAQVIEPGAVPGVALGAGCTPAVQVWVRAATRSAPADGTTPVDLVVEVANSKAGPSAVLDVTALLPPGMTYRSTVGVSTRDGAVWGPGTRPVAGSGAPSWGGFELPPGASVAIDLLAVVESGTPPGVLETAASAAIVSDGGFSRATYGVGFSTDDDVEVASP